MTAGGILFNITESALLSLGYLGIFYLMTLDSLMVPLGSEAIMTLAGVLAFQGKFNFWIVVIVAIIASMIGSTASWLIGRYGGRRFLEKYGRYVLIRKGEMDRGDEFFSRHGEGAVMFGRIIPLVRTYVSLPAGIAIMPYRKFFIFTLIGTAIFVVGLVSLGYLLSNEIKAVLASESLYSLAGAGIVVLALIVLVIIRLRHRSASTGGN